MVVFAPMFIFIFLCILACLFILIVSFIFITRHIYISMCVYIYIYVRVCVCLFLCTYVSIFISMFSQLIYSYTYSPDWASLVFHCSFPATASLHRPDILSADWNTTSASMGNTCTYSGLMQLVGSHKLPFPGTACCTSAWDMHRSFSDR